MGLKHGYGALKDYEKPIPKSPVFAHLLPLSEDLILDDLVKFHAVFICESGSTSLTSGLLHELIVSLLI